MKKRQSASADADWPLLSSHRVSVGDRVRIRGWRHPGSSDMRVVEAMREEPACQGGVLVRLNKPLQNGSTEISIAWIEGWK